MRIFIFITDDVVFKPHVLYRIIMERTADICGVAEVEYRKYRRSVKIKGISEYQFWGTKGYLVLGTYSYLLRGLARLPLPSFISSRMSNKNACRFFKVPYQYVRNVNDPAFLKALRRGQAESRHRLPFAPHTQLDPQHRTPTPPTTPGWLPHPC